MDYFRIHVRKNHTIDNNNDANNHSSIIRYPGILVQ